jgi:hypothetical protein
MVELCRRQVMVDAIVLQQQLLECAGEGRPRRRGELTHVLYTTLDRQPGN